MRAIEGVRDISQALKPEIWLLFAYIKHQTEGTPSDISLYK